MPIKRYTPAQIVMMLRQIEVSIANAKTTPQACKEAEITGGPSTAGGKSTADSTVVTRSRRSFS